MNGSFVVHLNERVLSEYDLPVDALYFESSPIACGRCVVNHLSELWCLPSFIMFDGTKWKSNPLREYAEQNNIAHNSEVWQPRETPYPWLRDLGKKLGALPLTGLVALEHVLQHDIKSVKLLGFTFYHDGKKFPEVVGSHRIARQVDYVRELLQNDSRVSADDKLMKLLGLKDMSERSTEV